MTHNPTSANCTFTTENQSRRLQEISEYRDKDNVESQSKPPKAAVSQEKSDRDQVRLEALQRLACLEPESLADLENEKDLSEEFNLYKEKLNYLHSQQRKEFLRESLPRYGLSEKATQTLLTGRDLEDLEALRAGPPKDLMLSLLKSSPDLIKKIYGVNLNSVFASAAAISNIYNFNNFNNLEKNFAAENSKNFLNTKSPQKDNAQKSGGPGRKSLALTKKAEKNLLLHSQLQQEENLQKKEMMISRKRKIPLDYSELNKNGVYDKSIPLELKPQKGKEKDLHAKSFSFGEEARNFFSSFVDAKFGDFGSASSKAYFNDFKNFNDSISNFNSSDNEKFSRTNKICIKRKTDNRRKNKLKNAHVPHLHFSHKLIPHSQTQEKGEGIAGPGRNGSAKNRRLNKNIDIVKELINSENAPNYINNNTIDLGTNNNISNNNLIIAPEENENLVLKTASSKSNLITQNQIKSLNLNESEEPSSSRERGRPSKKDLQLESLLSSKKNSSSNLIEKVKAGNAALSNDNFFSSVNEDFSKSSYDASQAKLGVCSSLNENEDMNEISNPLNIKEYSNEVDFLNETEKKLGRGRGGKHGPGRTKKAFYESKKDQAISSANELNKNDSFIKMSEETNVSNFDTHSEIKKLNFSVTHKPAAKPVVEKISKKFDPYLYFKNECIQSHQNNNRTEEEVEKECQTNWKNLDKDLKAVYFRMAEHEKKIFKKIRKLNSLSLKEKAEN